MSGTATGMARRGRRARVLIAGYLALLAVSHAMRWFGGSEDAGPPRPGERAVNLPAFDAKGARTGASEVRVAFLDTGPPASSGPPVVLVHGSPGVRQDFRTIAPVLARRRRVVAPDLPGFGRSSRAVPDYSLAAHARYVRALLDRLGVRRAHIVGFSMGGGVALHILDLEPARVASLTLLSSIGVQELELFGSYRINRVVHGVQLAGLWLLSEATPHFGWLDDMALDLPYARNFYDSDQRPLRGILSRVAVPTLVLHGAHDGLVPIEAAREHHRLVPQSELQILDGGHFLAFTRGEALAETIDGFLSRADAGLAVRREDADPGRVRAAREPFDPRTGPPLRGLSRAVAIAGLCSLGILAAGAWVVARRLWRK